MGDLKHVEKSVVGQKFGRWVIVSDLGRIKSRKNVIVECECGNRKQHEYRTLTMGRSKSCGCFKVENASAMALMRPAKHGLSKHLLFGVWRGMKSRCYNKKDKKYPDYGGRGILVCDEWKNDFLSFYNWAVNNGWEEGLINDRRNNDMGYSPENCRFVTDAISMRNTRRNFNIEFNGESKCITDWAKSIDISSVSLKKRIKHGWPLNEALFKHKN